MPNPPSAPDTKPPAKKSGYGKFIAFAVIVAVIGLVYWKFGDHLTLEALAEQESRLRELQESKPVAFYGIAFLIYVAVTGLSLPGAAPLTLVFGWLFGFWRGLLMVSFASTAGATLAFLFSRYILRDYVQNRFGDRLETVNNALEKEGSFYLFTLRLIPALPFFVINLLMGLTGMRVATYWWVSQLGMLPGTAAFVYAGSSVPDLATLEEKGLSGILSPQLIIAFVILGVLPLLIKRIVSKFRKDK